MVYKNRFYPHLMPDDIPVWERFLAEHEADYDHLEYDVRVGEGRPAPIDFPEPLRHMALDLSRRRIDAVGFTSATIDIIEITRLIDLKAVGQVIAYPVLYRQTYLPLQALRSVLVGEKYNTDIQPVLDQTNVTVFLYPPPE